MLTFLYSVLHAGTIRGLEPWLLFWIGGCVLYFAALLSFRGNRTKTGIKNVCMGFCITEVIFDLLWAVIFYFERFYLEYLGGVTYGFFMWIAMLTAAGGIASGKTCLEAKKEKEAK